MLTLILNLLAILFLLAAMVVLWFDVLAFDSAIDSPGMTAPKWESNKYRFVPGGGFWVYYKYRLNR